jgi:hypothetical protein
MSMLTLNGLVQNVFSKPESKDRQTGEVRPATENVQILAENILESGEKRLEMVTLKVLSGEVYRKLMGKHVRIPVGAFIANGSLLFYALKTEPVPLLAAGV